MLSARDLVEARLYKSEEDVLQEGHDQRAEVDAVPKYRQDGLRP